ncbi:D-alanyl-D-alanine dipeptidase, partial [Salmonella enterica]|nr:D-alanyl-D-alanine dipeptidase [Salmonella enterica]
MKKSDHDVHEKTASWSILQSEWLKKCGRLLLLLLYRFAIGWAFFQLLTIIVAGILLLGVLLFHPVIFVQTITITEKLNHVSVYL